MVGIRCFLIFDLILVGLDRIMSNFEVLVVGGLLNMGEVM